MKYVLNFHVVFCHYLDTLFNFKTFENLPDHFSVTYFLLKFTVACLVTYPVSLKYFIKVCFVAHDIIYIRECLVLTWNEWILQCCWKCLLYMSVKSSWSLQLFRSSLSILISCHCAPLISERFVLNSGSWAGTVETFKWV